MEPVPKDSLFSFWEVKGPQAFFARSPRAGSGPTTRAFPPSSPVGFSAGISGAISRFTDLRPRNHDPKAKRASLPRKVPRGSDTGTPGAKPRVTAGRPPSLELGRARNLARERGTCAGRAPRPNGPRCPRVGAPRHPDARPRAPADLHGPLAGASSPPVSGSPTSQKRPSRPTCTGLRRTSVAAGSQAGAAPALPPIGPARGSRRRPDRQRRNVRGRARPRVRMGRREGRRRGRCGRPGRERGP